MTSTLRGGRRGGKALSLAVLAEVAQVLARHGTLGCAPEVDEEDGQVVVTLRLHSRDTADALAALEVLTALRQVADVASLRGLADRYGIDAGKLEALLPAGDRDRAAAFVVALTDAECDALDLLIDSGCRLGGPVRMELRPALLRVLAKLRALDGTPAGQEHGDATAHE